MSEVKVEQRHREAASNACGNDTCAMSNGTRASLAKYIETGDDHEYWLSEHEIAQAIAAAEERGVQKERERVIAAIDAEIADWAGNDMATRTARGALALARKRVEAGK